MQQVIAPTIFSFDGPTWSVSCLMCGEYQELEAGGARPAGARCRHCGAAVLIDTVRPTRGSGMPAGISLGRTVGRSATLGGVQDWN